MKDKYKNGVYQIIRAILKYVLVISVGYNIYQASIIKAYEQNFDEFLQEIIDLKDKK